MVWCRPLLCPLRIPDNGHFVGHSRLQRLFQALLWTTHPSHLAGIHAHLDLCVLPRADLETNRRRAVSPGFKGTPWNLGILTYDPELIRGLPQSVGIPGGHVVS